MPALNQRDAIHYIATRQEFKASALSGSTYSLGQGRLSGEDLEKWYADGYTNKDGILYVVYSYGTPIAWFTTSGEWYVVSQKFSVTTSKHSNYVRRAIAESLQGVN